MLVQYSKERFLKIGAKKEQQTNVDFCVYPFCFTLQKLQSLYYFERSIQSCTSYIGNDPIYTQMMIQTKITMSWIKKIAKI